MTNPIKLEMQTSLDKITDKISSNFIREIKDNFSIINFEIIEWRLDKIYAKRAFSTILDWIYP